MFIAVLGDVSPRSCRGEGALPPSGPRIVSAGNRVHSFVPEVLIDIAQSAGIGKHAPFETQTRIGADVKRHWDLPDETNLLQATLEEGGVDVLTLVPAKRPDEGIENLVRLALEHNPGIRMMVDEFWLPDDVSDRNDRQQTPPIDRNRQTGEQLRARHGAYFRSVDESVQALNRKFGKRVLLVVPSGQAIIALQERINAGQVPGLKTQDELFVDPIDNVPPPVQALVGYCHFAVIFRRSPAGLPLPEVLAKSANRNWGERLNRQLQELAWSAVQDHPLSGVEPKIVKSDAAWRKILTREQFRVTRRKGTETPFRGAYWKTKTDGIYQCVCCGQPLFDSRSKYDSKTGWPSFWTPIDDGAVSYHEDRSRLEIRTEVQCSRCDAHLGHVFGDGPQPTGRRYCMNSAALNRVARESPDSPDSIKPASDQ